MGYLSCNAESAIAVCDPYNWDRRKKKSGSRRIDRSRTEIREFCYDELAAATGGFSAENFLGKGSHGSVYKAILDGGKLNAAVKKNATGARSGCGGCKMSCNSISQTENEIEVLSRVWNPRLVNLIGFCSGERKLLVVEYMPNGSLYELLHDGSGSGVPGWGRRVRHALQVARAVHALHAADPPVIHRDVKSSNVLIDERGNARLGDFGLAMRGYVEDVRVKCTPPAGTIGYLDPSYLRPIDLSTKSDVFSFGILLLEIISGRNAIDLNYSPPCVVDWAVPMIRLGDFAGIFDRRIGTPLDSTAIGMMAVLAARCVRSTVEKRPDMAEIVERLKLIRKRCNTPPVWTNLRRHVRCVDQTETVFHDETEETESKSVRCGSRRQKKVANAVNSGEHESEPEPASTMLFPRIRRDLVMRSRSVGPIRYARVEPDSDDGEGGEVALIGKVQAPSPVRARLGKSRSMMVVRSVRVLRNRESVKGTASDFLRLDISSFDKIELQEKPLVR